MRLRPYPWVTPYRIYDAKAIYNEFVYGRRLPVLLAYHAQRDSLSIDCGINTVIIQILFSSVFMPNIMFFYPRLGGDEPHF